MDATCQSRKPWRRAHAEDALLYAAAAEQAKAKRPRAEATGKDAGASEQ